MPYKPKPIRRPDASRPVDLRPSAWRRGYDSDWQKLAAAVLADEPLCRPCRGAGRVTPAELVDHIAPINDGGPRLDRANLQPLCRQCHAVKTADDVRKRRQG